MNALFLDRKLLWKLATSLDKEPMQCILELALKKLGDLIEIDK
jgi:hypothetical protein